MIKNSVTVYAEKRKRALDVFVLFVLTFALAVSVLTALNKTVAFTVRVEGSSMNPLLKNGDVVVVSRAAEVKRGSVVVADVEEGGPLIKRVIALGGETVWSVRGVVFIQTESGVITLNEGYVIPENAGGADVPRTTVPQGYVFLMGDNRAISLDSRVIGPVENERILGVVTTFWLKHKF